MKKLLIMTCALCVLVGAANAANDTAVKVDNLKRPPLEDKAQPAKQIHKIKHAHENAFERKLGLTEVQKLKARELRKNGHAKMKPVMEEIKAKKQEAEMIRNSKLTVEAQEEKLTVIDNDLAELQKKAAEIRKQNMKDFEAILTKDQKKTLKKMKKEGRKNFKQHKKELPPPPCKKVDNK